jgi:hypothetical protein
MTSEIAIVLVLKPFQAGTAPMMAKADAIRIRHH